MAIYRGTGGSGDATNDATITEVTQQAVNASESADAAAASATSAASSSASALTSKTAAQTSETNAATSETNASNSASAASTSATSASNSATAASTSESNASASETNAAASASSASTSATAASGSATTASTKASEAATSASSALTYKNAAEAAKTAAETAETNAETAETNAASSATAAAGSATSASGSATTATTKASEASTSASNAATSETNAATSETNAATSETNAASSATSASTSATSASTSASTATTKASEAATSASTATTKASEASTSASNAATSATNAATSATNAAASFDSFDDRYLGSKSSEPTVDNDGDALLTGALYFNSTTNTMKVYSGSSWLDAYATLSGALLATNNLSDLNNAATARTNLGLGTAATTASTDYATSAQGTTADNALPKAGGTMTGDIAHGDNVKAKFGASDDLQIYHDGSNSVIGDLGTGELSLQTNGTGVRIWDNANSQSMAVFNIGNDSKLAHNGSFKLATTSTGVDVTGTVSTDGIALTGNMTVTGTVDGRDVSADGTKLDTIATNANNYVHPTFAGDDFSVDTGALTGATVVSDIDINVTTDTNGHVTDANGSVATRTLTLADLGYTGETNATADQTASEILTAIKTVDGSGSGLDADLLDGLQASQFLRSDAADTMTSQLTMSGTSPQIKFNDTNGDDFWIHANTNNFYVLTDRDDNGTWDGTNPLLLQNSDSQAYVYGNKVWNAGNDGSGSGLDADTVDGLQASSFLRSNASDTTTGTITFNTSAVPLNFIESGYTGNGQYWRQPLDGGNMRFDVSTSGAGGFTTYFTPLQMNSDGTVTTNTVEVNGEIRINDTNTKIQEGSSNSLRVQTNSGYVDIGPQNTNWSHFNTDRSQFYFNKKIHAVDEIAVYNDNGTKLNTTGVFDNGNRVYSASNPPPAGGGGYNMIVFTSSGTYTKSSGVKDIKVTVTGGGAAGNRAYRNGTSGGSAGGTAIEFFNASSVSSSVSVTVGAGGVKGNTPTAGGTSSFGAYCSATGGAISAGAGGVGTGGTMNFTGGKGGQGLNMSGTSEHLSGGGGGSYWGGESSVTTAGGSYEIAGANGGAWGAGGQAACSGVSGSSVLGGDGGDGVVIVEEFF